MSGSNDAAEGGHGNDDIRQEVHDALDRFIKALNSHTNPRIENFWITRTPEAKRDSLQFMLRAELRYRLSKGLPNKPLFDSYLKRFPDYQDLVTEEWKLVEEEAWRGHAGLGSSIIAGRYTLQDELGRGGMGVVYRAWDEFLKRYVALKMVLSGTRADEGDLKRFQKEAEAVAQLEHPNIVVIHEVGKHDGQPFISLEFVEGGGLDKKISGKPQKPDWAADLVEKLARAVHFAHEQKIVHRDLKPSNVLLTGKGEPKIADFGLAKRLEDDASQTASGSIMGTPPYMAPEQADDKQITIGPQTDVYGLGAILYCLLTGRPPFQSSGPLDTVKQVLEQEPIPPRQLVPELDRDLETITLKCLQKARERRYHTAKELAEELKRHQAGEPILARPVRQVERAWRWCKRKPAVAGLCTMVAILVLVLGILGPVVAIDQTNLRRAADRDAQKARVSLDARRKAESDRRGAQITTLLQSKPQVAAKIVKELRGDAAVRKTLSEKLGNGILSQNADNRIRLVLLFSDRGQLNKIVESLLKPDEERKLEELLLIRDFLKKPYGKQLTDIFLPKLVQSTNPLQAACLLAAFDPKANFWPTHASSIAKALVNVLPSELAPYRDALRPVMHHLVCPLSAIFRDSQGEKERLFAADTLADHFAFANSPERLFDLLADADPKQFPIIFNRLADHKNLAIKLGHAEIDKKAWEGHLKAVENLAKRKANTAVMLMRMGAPARVWPLLRHSPDSRVRSYLIHRLGPLGADPRAIINKCFNQETDVTIKQALLFCLGEFDKSRLSIAKRTGLIEPLFGIYRRDANPSLHAAAEWLLRRWGQAEQLAAVDKKLQQSEKQLRSAGKKVRQWYINRQGQTFVILDADKFRMGSPVTERGRDPDHEFGVFPPNWELQKPVRIDRRFAICTTEVSHAQWRQFQASGRKPASAAARRRQDRIGSFAVSANWYKAAGYCNWLSKQEGIPKDQWCYVPHETNGFGPGMEVRASFLKLTGYRLPTEDEWEYACRAKTETSRYFGQSDVLLKYYAQTHVNQKVHRVPSWPVGSKKPNDFGLFDMYGNVFEWCGQEPGFVFDKTRQVMRGGAVGFPSYTFRSAYRSSHPADLNFSLYGFRVARTLLAETQDQR